MQSSIKTSDVPLLFQRSCIMGNAIVVRKIGENELMMLAHSMAVIGKKAGVR
jgi:hypothetical protein